MLRPRSFSFKLALLLSALDVVDARRVQDEPFKLILTPIHTATFAFTILLGLIFLIMSLSNSGKLGNRHKVIPSGHRSTIYYVGPVYPILILLATLSLVVFYVLYAVTIVYTLNESVLNLRPLTYGFVAGRDFVLHIAHWFIVCAMLGLLFVRERTCAGGQASRVCLRVVRSVLDGILLLALLAVILALAGLEGSLQRNYQREALNWLALQRAYIVLQGVLTVYAISSAFWTWRKLKQDSKYDLMMIGQVVKYISPFLFLFSVYEIVEHALIYGSDFLYSSAGAVESLLLARIIIVGITNSVVLWFAS
ncbi:hypothetical protein NP233_g6530 [Leucocoprinus birnbaumii]|uniref:Uncharacterized protein n=1 Tax=Leucocoprinus birnbaumii TaxID=56174 RepID=A0AAD5YVP5_9AGAR|nr:hypothetical protein NP233_g6530 [Leucocoprinus birnbaumii]